jgi:cytochrome b561
MIVRLIVRLTVKRPARANTGNPFLDRLGEWVHFGLYFFAFYILTLGGIIAIQRNLIGYVFGTGPVERVDMTLRMFHQFGWFAILGLLLMHLGGTVFHQFIIKDNLLGRMWFGK